MTIQFFGVSCFKITTKIGNEEVSLVTDPYSAKLGKLPRNLAGDILTISRRTHEHHNNIEAGTGENTFLIEYPGEYEVKGIPIYGIPADHEGKEDPGYHKNTMFHYIVDDMHIVHLGGCKMPLTDEQLSQLGEVDVLLVPVGGGDVLDPDTAADLVSRMEPRVVIPMHFEDTAKFSKALGIKGEEMEKLKIMKKDLPAEDTKLVILTRS